MYRVKIIGAGSIGNHLAHAARHMGWDVLVCDLSDEALERMRTKIYPDRYGKWDDAIKLNSVHSAPTGIFDIIFVGTPPDYHLPVALNAIREKPRVLVIEKPLCTPGLHAAGDFYEQCLDSSSLVLVGYDHVISAGIRRVEELVEARAIGDIVTIDVDFREHWKGIFAAHPWLCGPEDSYLGFWERGGGAGGEHSHGLNLWQHLAHYLGAGRVDRVNSLLRYGGERRTYDDIFFVQLATQEGLIGRVVQDVVTYPPKKCARLTGTEGVIEWICGFSPEGDAVTVETSDRQQRTEIFKKRRPDDFIQEMKFIDDRLALRMDRKDLDLDRGLDTMLVLAAAHRSAALGGSTVKIDYSKGYRLEAVNEFAS